MSDQLFPAVPPADESERDALAKEIETLAPMLGKVDTAATLSALLKVIARARTLGSGGFEVLHDLAAKLRENRAFDDLYILTSEMRTYGMEDRHVRRWEIQALIELGVFETALDLARKMIAKGPKDAEGQDGYSALGRIYKQMYIDAVSHGRKREPQVLALYLERAFAAYMRVWDAEKSIETAYYGVNAAAIAARAVADRTARDQQSEQVLTQIARKLAEDVLATATRGDDVWSLATQGEALIALGRYDEAARPYAAYAVSPKVSLFQLHASLRQLEEVWLIKGDDPQKGAAVRLLKAVILSKTGAQIEGAQAAPIAAQVSISAKEAQLISREFSGGPPSRASMTGGAPGAAPAPAAPDPKGYESIFSTNAPVAMQVIRNAMSRARAICRIHANMGGRDTPFATGFAVEGKQLHPDWGDAPVIVTNNHVISSRPGSGSQRFEYCEAVFISPDSDEMRRVGFAEVMWESDPEAHDITILRLKGPLPADVAPLTQLTATSLPPHAINDDGIGRVYVIGYPAGGELSFSFADNILLDHDAPKNCEVSIIEGVRSVKGVEPEPVRLHYRTPTLGGSSGSPVFDFNDFSLLGVHHRGLPDIEKLNKRGGRYAANQGIWIESIRAAIAETESEAGAETSHLGGSDAIRRWRSNRARPVASAPADAMPAGLGTQPVRVASEAARPGSRIFPGATGDLSAGLSPVAAQILKTGKASAAEITASLNESVIGLDDRTRIFETAMSPWRMICAIRCWWGTRLSVGTGALVSPSMLLTAGHVVLPRERRAVPDRIEITPGLNGTQLPYGTVPVASVSVHPRWVTDFDIATDVAAIHLAQPIGLKIGWFAAAMREADDLRGSWAHVSGYPGEKLENMDANGQPIAPIQATQLWHHSAPIVNVQNDRIFYAADTTPGQSGAPIYVVDPAVSPTPVIVGVHAYGKASTPVAVGNANSGAWVNAELFDLIGQWREESAGILSRSGSV